VHAASGLAPVDGLLQPGGFDVLVTDLILQSTPGIEILRRVRARGCDEPVILMTGEPSAETAAEALRLWAFDYLSKPVTKVALLTVVARALRYVDLIRNPFALLLRHVERHAMRADGDAADRAALAARVDDVAGMARRLAASNDACAGARAGCSAQAVAARALARARAVFGAGDAARLTLVPAARDATVAGDPELLADALVHALRGMWDGQPQAPARLALDFATPGWVAFTIEFEGAPAAPSGAEGVEGWARVPGLCATQRIVAAHGGRFDPAAAAAGRCRIELPAAPA